jgi:two-component system, OmpR family, response regulator CpxR
MRAEPSQARHPVLIVEDDEQTRDAMREILEDEGYVITCAVNGEEALKVLAEQPRPRLILLDLMMPVMNGWELLRALRDSAALAGIPVVVLSSVSAADAPPGVPTVKKPASMRTLLRLVEEYAV